MVHADGRLYVSAADGTTYVLAAATEYKLLAENPLGEVTRGSLAFSDGQIFVRTYDALYCIGERK
jgi:outer membrane protein assembly factor BamB